jgi:putative oxidoreductase
MAHLPPSNHRKSETMSLITSLENALTRHVPDSLVSLALRFGLAVPFFKSGLTKWSGIGQLSDSAILLFQEEFKFHVLGKIYDYPFPKFMAYGAGVAEILFPVLLVLGLFGRLAAFALLIMTIVIQLTIPNGWPIHLTWAAMALGILVLGSGKLSFDNIMRGA